MKDLASIAMQKFDQILNWYQTVVPESAQRQQWYGSVAQTYDRLRPKYADAVWNPALDLAAVPDSGRILEVGCGPGTATISLAQRGYDVVAIEPSTDTYTLACHNLADYDRVEIINTNFEDWQSARKFDAIVAATAWHWVPPEGKYQKATNLLTDGGSIILLWNTGMQPEREIIDCLEPVLSKYVPEFAKYRKPEIQLQELQIFTDEAIASGLFILAGEGSETMRVEYSIEDYLQLLTTYSPFIALTTAERSDLLGQMQAILVRECGERIDLSYLSIYQVLRRGTRQRAHYRVPANQI